MLSVQQVFLNFHFLLKLNYRMGNNKSIVVGSVLYNYDCFLN